MKNEIVSYGYEVPDIFANAPDGMFEEPEEVEPEPEEEPEPEPEPEPKPAPQLPGPPTFDGWVWWPKKRWLLFRWNEPRGNPGDLPVLDYHGQWRKKGDDAWTDQQLNSVNRQSPIKHRDFTKVYHARVRARNANGHGPWSNTWVAAARKK